MGSGLIVLSFGAIALMRVAQKVTAKKVSREVQGRMFFRYGGYYNLLSALFSLITLFMVGFDGFNIPTILCALATAICLALELFATIEGLKVTTLVVNQMFSVGALIIPCIVGIFFFNEPMSIWQWLGVLLFAIAMYFMVSETKVKQDKKKGRFSLKTILLLLLTLFSGGGTMVAQKAFAVVVPNGSVATYSFLMFALNAIILYVGYGISSLAKNNKTQTMETELQEKQNCGLPRGLIVCGLILAFAVFVINMLVTELGKYISSAILFSVSYAIGIVITILVGAIFYKEKITIKNIIGIVLCVGALALINFL
jgi:drug/metabolite transporter (DMT)-like permease